MVEYKVAQMPTLATTTLRPPALMDLASTIAVKDVQIAQPRTSIPLPFMTTEHVAMVT